MNTLITPEITRVKTATDVQGILDLQHANLRQNLELETAASQGFLTVKHTFDVMKRMNDTLPSIIAKDGDRVVGYALAMLPEFKTDVPALVGLFDMIDKTNFQGKPLRTHKHVIVGQLCVDVTYRGLGLVNQLYAHYRSELSADFDLCVTDISSKNGRSLKAHQNVGFCVVESFFDIVTQENWELVVWNWR